MCVCMYVACSVWGLAKTGQTPRASGHGCECASVSNTRMGVCKCFQHSDGCVTCVQHSDVCASVSNTRAGVRRSRHPKRCAWHSDGCVQHSDGCAQHSDMCVQHSDNVLRGLVKAQHHRALQGYHLGFKLCSGYAQLGRVQHSCRCVQHTYRETGQTSTSPRAAGLRFGFQV